MSIDPVQKKFLSDIAHELRSPLSIIKMNTDIALLDTTLDPRLKKRLLSNGEEVDRMTHLIQKLLDDTEK